MNNSINTTEKKRLPISKQDWTNFNFFVCDDETRKQALRLLKERDYLLSNGMPNKEKITEEAEFFADSLAKRLTGNWQAKRFGIRNVAENIRRFTEIRDLSALYFYITNVYGTVWWNAPYNLQRLPVHQEALSLYLNVFSNTFIKQVTQSESPAAEVPVTKKTAKTTKTKKPAKPAKPVNSEKIPEPTTDEEIPKETPENVKAESEKKEDFDNEEEGMEYDED